MQKILTSTNYELISPNDRTNVRFYTSHDPGSYVPPHWHDAIEIIYLQEGELKFTVENTVFHLQENQCILVPPDKIHATLCTRPNTAIVFQIPADFARKYIPDSDRRLYVLNDPAATPIEQTKNDQFKDKLARMQFLIDNEPDGYLLLFNSLLFDVLFQLYHNFSRLQDTDDNARQNKKLERLKPVLDYINHNYRQPISLDEIARVAMFDPKYFCRFFKKNMGTTFLEYQNDLRIAHIYNDLLHTEDKVSDILERHGFTNYKLFRRLFHQHFGMTPQKIRKQRSA